MSYRFRCLPKKTHEIVIINFSHERESNMMICVYNADMTLSIYEHEAKKLRFFETSPLFSATTTACHKEKTSKPQFRKEKTPN